MVCGVSIAGDAGDSRVGAIPFVAEIKLADELLSGRLLLFKIEFGDMMMPQGTEIPCCIIRTRHPCSTLVNQTARSTK